MGLYLGSTKIPTISFYKQSGIIPSGIFTIPSTSGTYDVTSYAFAQGDFGYGRLSERVSGDITEYSNSSATQITPYALAGTNISSISMPNVTLVGSSAFLSCRNLTSISFSLCTSVGNYAFSGCSNLSSVSLPVCSSLGQYAFADCRKLTSLNFPECLAIGSYAFYYCSFTSASFPKCISIHANAFYYCHQIETMNFPSCTYIGGSAFSYCSRLTSLSLPLCQSILGYTFNYCSNLSTISLPKCSNIGGNLAFANCFKLLSLYLMSTSVVGLANVSAFASTPISNYTTSTGGVYGSIYVPSSLLASYKVATNWANYSDRMVGI